MAVRKRRKPQTTDAVVQSFEAGGLVHLIRQDNEGDPDERYRLKVRLDAKNTLKAAWLEPYGADAHPDQGLDKPAEKKDKPA